MEHRPRVVIPGDDPPLLQDTTHLKRLRRYGDVDLYTDAPETLQEQAARSRGASIVLATGGAFTWPGEVLRALPELKLLSAATIGTDSLDLQTAAELGITVCNVPREDCVHRGGACPCADARCCAPDGHPHRRSARRALAAHQRRNAPGQDPGQSSAPVTPANTWPGWPPASACGSRLGLFTHRPSEPSGWESRSWSWTTCCAPRTWVSIHLRLTEASHHLIGRRELELMKQGSLLLNIARGAIVDNDALTEALDSGHLGGAGLDVFETEPVPSDTRLLACKHVVLTPHVADATPEGTDRFAEGVVDNVIAYLEGRPQNVVMAQ